MGKTVLIVEDDNNIAELLRLYLEKEGYATLVASDGGAGLEQFRQHHPDIVLLDVMMPVMDGWEVCRAIRQTDKKTPIIMLTAKGETTDKVSGLKMGADDYITKPFRPRELIARIGNALRKSGRAPSAFQLYGLWADTASGIVKKDGKEVFLSALEYRLLLVFLNNPHRILTRDQLIDELWDAAGEFVNNNTLTVYIKRLREKIEEDPANPQIIRTVRGTGYRLGGGDVSE